MSSFTCFHPPADGIITLPLRKFSHLTTASPQGRNSQWSHFSNLNLLVVLEQIIVPRALGIPEGKKVLKVLQGGQLLEEIYLDELVSQARYDEERSRSQPLNKTSRLCFIIAKKPVVAVRYQLPSGQCRRIQMQFEKDEGYAVVHGALLDHYLPLNDRNEQSASQEKGYQNLSGARVGDDYVLPRLGSTAPSSQEFARDRYATSSQELVQGQYLPSIHGIVQNQYGAEGNATSGIDYVPGRPFSAHTREHASQQGCITSGVPSSQNSSSFYWQFENGPHLQERAGCTAISNSVSTFAPSIHTPSTACMNDHFSRLPRQTPQEKVECNINSNLIISSTPTADVRTVTFADDSLSRSEPLPRSPTKQAYTNMSNDIPVAYRPSQPSFEPTRFERYSTVMAEVPLRKELSNSRHLGNGPATPASWMHVDSQALPPKRKLPFSDLKSNRNKVSRAKILKASEVTNASEVVERIEVTEAVARGHEQYPNARKDSGILISKHIVTADTTNESNSAVPFPFPQNQDDNASTPAEKQRAKSAMPPESQHGCDSQPIQSLRVPRFNQQLPNPGAQSDLPSFQVAAKGHTIRSTAKVNIPSKKKQPAKQRKIVPKPGLNDYTAIESVSSAMGPTEEVSSAKQPANTRKKSVKKDQLNTDKATTLLEPKRKQSAKSRKAPIKEASAVVVIQDTAPKALSQEDSISAVEASTRLLTTRKQDQAAKCRNAQSKTATQETCIEEPALAGSILEESVPNFESGTVPLLSTKTKKSAKPPKSSVEALFADPMSSEPETGKLSHADETTKISMRPEDKKEQKPQKRTIKAAQKELVVVDSVQSQQNVTNAKVSKNKQSAKTRKTMLGKANSSREASRRAPSKKTVASRSQTGPNRLEAAHTATISLEGISISMAAPLSSAPTSPFTSVRTKPTRRSTRLNSPSGARKSPQNDLQNQNQSAVEEEYSLAVEDFLRRHVSLSAATPAAAPSKDFKAVGQAPSLAEYAKIPTAERRAAIDAEIVEMILDPGFQRLVEDVEGAWMRIGLGL